MTCYISGGGEGRTTLGFSKGGVPFSSKGGGVGLAKGKGLGIFPSPIQRKKRTEEQASRAILGGRGGSTRGGQKKVPIFLQEKEKIRREEKMIFP